MMKNYNFPLSLTIYKIVFTVCKITKVIGPLLCQIKSDCGRLELNSFHCVLDKDQSKIQFCPMAMFLVLCQKEV